ncbi:glycosyltransferase [Terrabacter sp. MAHUQ-38]|uniref:glycosyltransferase n=1 Tax=unclassified Terrabacter TaxID=2630222 RepID=UPI00165E348B|nr:glycosyltransferase [Terrabacter sp. MAHUQ-38]MBC9820795.1 glycosyltransferase [Terrabacter sp. MAHUQ-38]
MRVLLLGMGSRGDVQPLVALGERLRRLGYAVSLAAPADLGHVVAGSSVEFAPLWFDLEGPLRDGLGRESLRGSATTQVREARLMRQVMAETAGALATDIGPLVAGADAVVSGALTFDLLRPAGDLVRARRGLPRQGFRHYSAAARRTPTILGASPHVVLALRTGRRH